MSNQPEPLIINNKENDMFKKISDFLMQLFTNIVDFVRKLWEKKYTIPSIFLLFGVLFIFLGPCLLNNFKSDFTNEMEEVTQEPEEPCHDGTDSDLINTPLCSEKTYQNTSLETTSPSEFEVLKNFDIIETNNIVSIKEKINDYNNQPSFLPGKFN